MRGRGDTFSLAGRDAGRASAAITIRERERVELGDGVCERTAVPKSDRMRSAPGAGLPERGLKGPLGEIEKAGRDELESTHFSVPLFEVRDPDTPIPLKGAGGVGEGCQGEYSDDVHCDTSSRLDDQSVNYPTVRSSHPGRTSASSSHIHVRTAKPGIGRAS